MPLTTNNTPSRKLYRLVFPDGRTYVGITKLLMRERMYVHRRMAKSHKGKLFVAWRDLGEPAVEVLAVVAEHMWAETERRAIAVLRPELNSCPGGHGEGRTASADTRAKMSAASKGRKLSAEARLKIGAANKGRSPSAESRAASSAANKGKVISAAHRAAISAAHTGKVVSEETRAKVRAALVGRPRSAEVKAKLSAANKGKSPSTETRSKISATLLGKAKKRKLD